MKPRIFVLLLTTLGLSAAMTLPTSAQTPSKLYAQQLVDKAVARHPDVVVLVMHVTPPNSADNVIIASNIGRNTYGIYTLDLKTGKRGNFAIENSNFDLAQASTDEYPDPRTLVYDRFTRKLEGIRFEARFRTAVWVKPELQATQKELETVLKGRSVELLEWDAAVKRILVLVRGPADAGAFYIFNRETAKLAQFARRAPWLDTNETQPSTDFAFENPKGGGRGFAAM